jgi:fructosamine-3-kinase
MAPRDGSAPVSADWLADHLGVQLRQSRPVGGGSVHRAWCLTVEPTAGRDRASAAGPGPGGEEDRLFAKTNQARALPLLQAEAEGLAALARAAEGTGLTVPQPLALGVDAGQAVLLLPWHELQGPAAPDSAWYGLGAALARMHRRSLTLDCTEGDRPGWYGWPRDNVIGAGPQPNGWERQWGRFFRDRRLQPQFHLLEQAGPPLRGTGELLERLPGWLADHRPEPCLVHGDLWCGNAAIGTAGPLLFDPAVYRGDREVDLAMAQLFGGFPGGFFRGYRETWPLPEGHAKRRPFYDLYHLLNHANLFGGSYGSQAGRLIQALLA